MTENHDKPANIRRIDLSASAVQQAKLAEKPEGFVEKYAVPAVGGLLLLLVGSLILWGLVEVWQGILN